jgi:hypothetical protein
MQSGFPTMIETRFPYETCRWSSGRPDEAKCWFEELELTGPRNVRARLAQTDAGSAGSLAIGATQITIGFAQEWLAWHDRQKDACEAVFRRRQIFWTRWAALAASCAAAAAIVGWIVTISIKQH